MRIDPDGYVIGPLPEGRRQQESGSGRRPLRTIVDSWLREGGWQGGENTACSKYIDLTGLTLTERTREKERWRGRFRNELRARRWYPEGDEQVLVHYEWAIVDERTARLSWWVDDAWTRRPPPSETDVAGARAASQSLWDSAGRPKETMRPSNRFREEAAADDGASQVADLAVGH